MNPQLQLMLSHAVQAFQGGNIERAISILKKILQADSKNLIALNMFGLIEASRSRYKEAAELLAMAARINPHDFSIQYNLAKALEDSGEGEKSLPHHKRAVKLDPNNEGAWLNYGKTASNLHAYEEALVCFEKALSLNPDYAEAFLNKGIALNKLMRADAAISSIEKALEINPSLVEAWEIKGSILKYWKRYEEALRCFDSALTLQPNHIDAWVSKGDALHQLRRFEDAISCFEKVLSVDPNHLEALSNSGVLLTELKRYEEAILYIKKALKVKSDYPEIWSNLGVALFQQKRYEEAIISYDKALSIKTDLPQAWLGKSAAFTETKRYDDALVCIDKAINLQPNYSEAWSNKGLTLVELNRYNEAIAAYEKAIYLDDNFYDAYWNKSCAQLIVGDFKSGWENYEYRWKRIEADIYRHPNIPVLQSLDGVSKKKILVWCDQSYGDSIQFSRYVNELTTLGATIILEAQAPLVELFRKSFIESSIIKLGESVVGVDFQVPLGSLPLLFGTTLQNMPNTIPYLKGTNANYHKWRDRLNLSEKKLNIALACSGNTAHFKNDKNRPIKLELFEPLIEIANLFLVQKNIEESDKEFLCAHSEIKFLGDEIETFDDTAAIIRNMDLTISIDTSIAHLSGALGKETWVLVSWAPDWRWLLDRVDSPWYPTAKIFRQMSIGDWTSVLKKLHLNLKKYCK